MSDKWVGRLVKSKYATISFRTSLVPIKLPTVVASFNGTPIKYANTENILPSISFNDRCVKSKEAKLTCKYFTIQFPDTPRTQSIIATRATSAKIIATTLIATFIPSDAPAEIASNTLI